MAVISTSKIFSRATVVRRQFGDAVVLGLLIVLACAFAGAAVLFRDQVRVTSLFAVPLLVGGLVLRTQQMRWLFVCMIVLLGSAATAMRISVKPVTISSLGTLLVIAGVAYELARRRDRLGMRDARVDTLLHELRHRLRVQGELPTLPEGWRAESELRPAGRAGFAGDFLVSSMTCREGGHALGQAECSNAGPGCLELALVDVSGKGVDAGTRALLFSGAMGGLLGSVASDRFLPEANRYLLRQRWHYGFASAVHVWLDLATGEFRVESAGHPPVAHFDAGTGTWHTLPSRGPVLGVMNTVTFTPAEGQLRPGDALLLYTDGVVEAYDRDLDVGVDRLLGQAESLVPRGGFAGGAAYLLDSVPMREDDDRALLLLWRER